MQAWNVQHSIYCGFQNAFIVIKKKNLKDKINCEKTNKLPSIGGEPQYFSHVPEFIAFNTNNITLNEEFFEKVKWIISKPLKLRNFAKTQLNE